VLVESGAHINYKIKQEMGKKYDYIHSGPWVESLVGQTLGMVDEFKAQQGSLMKIFHDTHLISKFTLSPTT